MLRPVIGFLAGLIVGAVVVGLIEQLGHMAFPPPAGIERDQAAMAAYIASAPVAALVFPLVAWVAGAFLGGWVAAFLGRRWHRIAGTLVGAAILGLGALNFLTIPHPMWFLVLAIMLVVPAGWMGGNLAARGR